MIQIKDPRVLISFSHGSAFKRISIPDRADSFCAVSFIRHARFVEFNDFAEFRSS